MPGSEIGLAIEDRREVGSILPPPSLKSAVESWWVAGWNHESYLICKVLQQLCRAHQHGLKLCYAHGYGPFDLLYLWGRLSHNSGLRRLATGKSIRIAIATVGCEIPHMCCEFADTGRNLGYVGGHGQVTENAWLYFKKIALLGLSGTCCWGKWLSIL
jgi:hypothetical protein